MSDSLAKIKRVKCPRPNDEHKQGDSLSDYADISKWEPREEKQHE